MHPLDLYRAANLLIQQHGKQAKARAVEQMQELQAAGDEQGARVWMEVIDAVVVLEATEPMKGQATH